MVYMGPTIDCNIKIIGYCSISVCVVVCTKWDNVKISLLFPTKHTTGMYTSQTYLSSDDRFEWDEFTRGQMLAAFSYGYVTTQLIGGRLAELYGVKLVYGVSLVGTAILSLLSPAVARDGRDGRLGF